MEFSKLELLGAFGLLVSVISALWVLLNGHMKKDNDRLKRYEKINEESTQQIIKLTGEHRELKGRIDAIENLSNQVIEEIQKVKE